MKRQYKEPELEIIEYSLRYDVATGDLNSFPDYGTLNLDEGIEVEF